MHNMIDHRPSKFREVAGRRPLVSGRGRQQGIEDRHWVSVPGYALVEVAEEHDPRFPPEVGQDPAEAVEVSGVILPRSPVPPPGSDMGVAPGDADANRSNAPDRGLSHTGHEPTPGKALAAQSVHPRSRMSAPEHHLATAAVVRVAVVRIRKDPVPSQFSRRVDHSLGHADDLRIGAP